MKRSTAIPLVLLGTLAVGGCYQQDEPRQQLQVSQNSYKNRDDCVKDWGTDSRHCQSNTGGGYYGPRYYWNPALNGPMVIDSDGSHRAVTGTYLNGNPSAAAAAAAGNSRSTATSSFATSRTTTTSTVSVARGGFGGSAHGFSGGG